MQTYICLISRSAGALRRQVPVQCRKSLRDDRAIHTLKWVREISLFFYVFLLCFILIFFISMDSCFDIPHVVTLCGDQGRDARVITLNKTLGLKY